MKQAMSRLSFVILSTAIMVFFSEKAFWYPQGYAIGELIFFYLFPVYLTLWAIDFFHVSRLPQLILVAALYAFLIEGVLTPVIFEAGLFDPIMPAYFIGWHGLLSLIFGWYFLRKWLINGESRKLLIGSILFGLLWGVWSITYWLPENLEGFAFPGQWSTADFGLHALTFTLMLMAAHWLLGHLHWQTTLQPSRTEKWIVAASLLFFFATLSFPAAPFGFLKLGVLLVVTLLPLHLKPTHDHHSILNQLAGTVKIRALFPLLAMPIMATAVYGAAIYWHLSEESIRAILELTPLLQSLIGFITFIWAWTMTIRPSQTITHQEFA